VPGIRSSCHLHGCLDYAKREWRRSFWIKARAMNRTDDEALTLRVTVIGGQRYVDDFIVLWRGLTIGRIMRATGTASDLFPAGLEHAARGVEIRYCNRRAAQPLTAWARIRIDVVSARARPSERSSAVSRGLGWAIAPSPLAGVSAGPPFPFDDLQPYPIFRTFFDHDNDGPPRKPAMPFRSRLCAQIVPASSGRPFHTGRASISFRKL
jgi:hypothetical protein